MKTLVIAEKPSVAQDIVRALAPVAGRFDKHEDHFENEQYVVTSAVGHLLEIQAPEAFDVKRGKWSFAHLPVIPPHFDLKPVEKTKSRLAAVVKQARRKDVGRLVNACDAGREGELIFRLIAQYAFDGKHAPKPVERLWLQSMTPQAIREGFGRLRSDAQMQGLADAARSRSEADWLVGINGTRAMTAFNSQGGGFFLTTVGRVQTPTLAIVVDREEQIRKHVPRDYWEVHATFLAQAGSYQGRWFDPDWKKDPQDAEKRPERLWSADEAARIAAAVRGQACSVREESKPSTQASPLLFDLTSLQREANGRFGFSAKTTLALAQSLYEKHKALTYPRTDSRWLPEDYLPVARQTFEMLAASAMPHLAGHAQTALAQGWVRASKRIFDNAKVSDHFAIIPTLQAPGALSEAEQKLYDLVARRFMAVFFPSAEYLITTRITTATHAGAHHHFRSDGKVLVKPGWLAIYGKEAEAESQAAGQPAGQKGEAAAKSLVPVAAGEMVRNEAVDIRALQTRPPARYSEATLLGAMEGAGKLIDDEELRAAMQEKGLGTPATRAAIIEGLLTEKYMLREGRELVPTAKATQLMTLLRGLQVEELSRPQLTGEWEAKLARMERGQLARADFMREIADMTARIVAKAKEFNRDSVPGDYATLAAACPNCGGQIKENYRRYACTGQAAGGQAGQGCGFSITKTPAGRTLSVPEAEALLAQRRIGPLEGFRSKAGWPFTAELTLAEDAEAPGRYKLEFDFGDSAPAEETPQAAQELAAQPSLGPCPRCGSAVKLLGKNYVCEKSVATSAAPASCDFKSGQTILQQPISAEQMGKLLQTGKTDLLDKFISNRTRRPFAARLAWSAGDGKVIFEFEPREGARARPAYSRAAPAASAAKPAAKTTTKAAAKTAKAAAEKKKTPRTGSLKPSAALAAVIGPGPFGRGEVMQKLWDYIKAHNLQDPKDKRTLIADEKLRPLFEADRIGMFKLAGIAGKHLS